MLPRDVAANSTLRRRFQQEVAYSDRLPPPKATVDPDTELLASSAAVLIIAWLWPSPSYEPGFDPFASASEQTHRLMRSTSRHAKLVGSEPELEFVRAVDLERQSRLLVVASRSRQIIESTALAVDRSPEDLRTHLRWRVPMLDLGHLLNGHSPYPFSIIVGLCDALQLEFTDAWVLVDPHRLATSIDRSVLASRISERLRSLTLDDLESTDRRLQRRPVDAGNREEPGVHRAPKKGGRYWSLYEALASDERDAPDFALDEIDRFLVEGGEPPLPDSARRDRSWWAGSEVTGHPQVSAWWAAGYRVRNLEIDRPSGRVVSVGFEALTGRSDWFADSERLEKGEYRVPGPQEVEIYRHENDLLMARLTEENFRSLGGAVASMATAIDWSGIERLAAEMRRLEPDDPDVRHLVEFLEEVGEANRAQIEGHFNRNRKVRVDSSWTTNLLTRARRQGWTVNNGTRSRPRWASTSLIAKLMFQIADNLSLQRPTIEPRDSVPVDFLRDVAKTVGVATPESSGPEIARDIIESRGGIWQPEFVSAEMSVTGLGLEAIRDAVGVPIPDELL